MPAKITSVTHFGGAWDTEELPNGNLALKFYATPQHAMAAGLDQNHVRHLFEGVQQGQTQDPCRKNGPYHPGNDPERPMLIGCVKDACTNTCNIYSRTKPKPHQPPPTDDWVKEAANPAPYDSGKLYKCECE